MVDVKLTKAQQAAVDCRGSRILVSAAAGSGKTKVLVDRLMSYICDDRDPANVDEFLIITYTKAAAAELRSKISAQLSARLAAQPENQHLRRQLSRIYLAKISTVHAFCGEILREYAYQLDIPADFRIAEGPESQELRQRAMDKVLEAAYRNEEERSAVQAFFDTLGMGRDDRKVPEIIAQMYDKAQCHLDPKAFLDQCREKNRLDGIVDVGQTPWGALLLEDLRRFYREQEARILELSRLAQLDGSLCKKVAPMLCGMAETLGKYGRFTSWDEVVTWGVPAFDRMPVVKEPEDPDLKERISEAKADCTKKLKKKMEAFYGPSREVLEDLGKTGQAMDGLFDLVEAFSQAFQREKARRRVLDFGDLEHLAIRLLLGRAGTAQTAAAREIGRRFREVMVDEYQDSNSVQDSIFSALTQERRNLFMVGDVKQSIYRFRLADPTIFLDKYRQYPHYEEAKAGEDRKILLSENFRSGGGVLAGANDVFSCTMTPEIGGLYYGEGEALKEGVSHVPLDQPEVELHCISFSRKNQEEKAGRSLTKYDYEADFAAERIRNLIVGENFVRQGDHLRRITAGDIVILLRAPETAAGYYANALAKRGIACVTGSKGNILQTAEVSALLSLLRVIDNPLQDIPLVAVLASPVFSFTADRLAELRARQKKGAIYDCLCLAAEEGQEDAQTFLSVLKALRKAAREKTLSGLVEEIYLRTRLDMIYAAMADGSQRRENLRLFYETAAGYEDRGRKSLSQFLSYLDKLDKRGLTPEEGNASGDAVTIMSIHKSKGLEFPVVVLGNLSAGFNTDDLKKPVLTDAELGVGCDVVDRGQWLRYSSVAKRAIAMKLRAENLSEELRVLYVAMTRAKDRLVMLYTSNSLEGDLQSIAREMTLPRCEYLSRQADCLGHWVLMGALTRTEAGALHQLSGRPETVEVRPYPWLIQVHEGRILQDGGSQVNGGVQTAGECPPDLWDRFHYVYPHLAAAESPSKRTATQMKGRNLDAEAADQAPPQRQSGARLTYPDFMSGPTLDPRQMGVATHLAMQFLRYECCGTAEGIRAELQRLVESEFLTRQQADAVAVDQIQAFFESSLGRRLMTGENVLREFKFSILEDGADTDPALRGESFLLQGVVDCCLMEPDGLTILDFKTDRVRPGQEQERAARYAGQVRTYGRALQRIFDKPAKRLCLYFFQTGILVDVPVEK